MRPIEALENVGSLVKRTGASFALPALPSTAVEASDASRVMAQPEFSRWTNCYCRTGQRLAGTLGGRAVPNGVGQWISNHPEAGSTDKVILLELGSSGLSDPDGTRIPALSCHPQDQGDFEQNWMARRSLLFEVIFFSPLFSQVEIAQHLIQRDLFLFVCTRLLDHLSSVPDPSNSPPPADHITHFEPLLFPRDPRKYTRNKLATNIIFLLFYFFITA